MKSSRLRRPLVRSGSAGKPTGDWLSTLRFSLSSLAKYQFVVLRGSLSITSATIAQPRADCQRCLSQGHKPNHCSPTQSHFSSLILQEFWKHCACKFSDGCHSPGPSAGLPCAHHHLAVKSELEAQEICFRSGDLPSWCVASRSSLLPLVCY